MKLKFSFLFLLIINFFFSQTVKIISSDDSAPIEGVVLMNKAGEYLGKTNVNGEIDESLAKNTDFLLMNHPLIIADTLFINKIVNGEYKTKTIKETKIPEVNIVSSNKDFIIVKGYFNSYVTNNSEFNIFVDGIIEYVFDRKTGQYKSENIREYRSFILDKKKDESRKEVASYVFDDLLKLPEMKVINLLNDSENNFNKIYSETDNKTIYVRTINRLTDKEFKLFGYVFKNGHRENILTFDGELSKPSPNRLSNFSNSNSISVKHKSEEVFSKIIVVGNFYPAEIFFKNKNEIVKGVKFDREISNYKTRYWEQDSNASFYEFLSRQFKDSFKQKENKN